MLDFTSTTEGCDTSIEAGTCGGIETAGDACATGLLEGPCALVLSDEFHCYQIAHKATR